MYDKPVKYGLDPFITLWYVATANQRTKLFDDPNSTRLNYLAICPSWLLEKNGRY
jgi:hypothetical protein